jgi:hypothetical protein
MRKLVFLMTLGMLAVLAPLHATSVQRLSLDELVSRSHSIVQGDILSSNTYRSADGKLILTSYTVQVEDTLKGSAAGTVMVTTIGGQIGNTVLHVSGMPVFQTGEKAVLFLEQTGKYTTVFGLNQGKFAVSNGQVSNSMAGLSFPGGGVPNVVRMPLDEFKRQVKLRLSR